MEVCWKDNNISVLPEVRLPSAFYSLAEGKMVCTKSITNRCHPSNLPFLRQLVSFLNQGKIFLPLLLQIEIFARLVH